MTGGTRNDHRHAADICRENGWGVGTRLIGDAETGLDLVEQVVDQDERAWSLAARDWCRIVV